MKPCEPKIRKLLDEQPGYRQAVANLESDCASVNSSANIPEDIERAIKDTCDADPDRPFVESELPASRGLPPGGPFRRQDVKYLPPPPPIRKS